MVLTSHSAPMIRRNESIKGVRPLFGLGAEISTQVGKAFELELSYEIL